MRAALAVFGVLIIILPFVSWAEETSPEFAILLSMAVIDYRQSIDMFYHDDMQELNPLLEETPSRRSMLGFGAIGLGLTYLLADVLPKPWSQIIIDSVVASEKMNIEENRRAHHGWNTEGPPIVGRELGGIPIMLSFRF